MILRSSNKIEFKEKLKIKSVILKCPYDRGVALWNALSPELQHAHAMKLFKKSIKKVKLRW